MATTAPSPSSERRIRPPSVVTDRADDHVAAMAKYAGRTAPREHTADLHSLIDNAIEGIFRTSAEGTYLIANRALAMMYGYDSVHELMASMTNIGQQLYVDPQRRNLFRWLLTKQDSITGFEAEVRCKDRSRIWVREKARVVRDAAGSVLWYEGFVEDITEERRSRARLGLWERAGLSSAHAIGIFANDGGLLEANPAYAALFGGNAPNSTAGVLRMVEPRSEPDSWRDIRLRWASSGVAFREDVCLRIGATAVVPVTLSLRPVDASFGSTGETLLTIVHQ